MQIQKYDIRKSQTNEFEERYWDPLNVPVLDVEGNVSFIVHSVVDVTRTILAEEGHKEAVANATKLAQRADKQEAISEQLYKVNRLLQESEEKFKALADNIPNLAWMANADGWIFWYNKRWYEYTGTTAKGMEGWGWQSVHDPNALPQVLKQWKKSIRTKKAFDMVFPLRGKDGEFRSFLTRVIPIKDEQGKVTRWFGTNTDITEQKQAEQAQRRLAAIVESSDDAIVSKNLDGIVMTWNKGAEKIFGYKAEEIIGKSIRTIIPPELQYEEDKILSTLRQGKRIDHFQTVRMAKDGRRVEISLTVSPIKDKEGHIVGASKIARDITQEKYLQRQKDEFLGIASHELKTPVTSIKSYAQVLKHRFTKEGNQNAAQLLGKLDAQIDKLTNLIGDLLDITKIESGKMQFNNKHFLFDELVDEVVEELQRTTDKHILIKKGKTDKTIYADRERISQVLNNLISNAIKYSPYANEIHILSSADHENIKLCVQDFGIGIPRDKKDKVFERFFRASGPGKETYPGLGLGLYISSEIVKRSNGRIWVESIEGKGSTFCFILPLKKPRDTEKKITVSQQAEEEIKHS